MVGRWPGTVLLMYFMYSSGLNQNSRRRRASAGCLAPRGIVSAWISLTVVGRTLAWFGTSTTPAWSRLTLDWPLVRFVTSEICVIMIAAPPAANTRRWSRFVFEIASGVVVFQSCLKYSMACAVWGESMTTFPLASTTWQPKAAQISTKTWGSAWLL